MNLSYHGITRNPAPSVEFTDTNETGHVLGKTQRIMQPNIPARQQHVGLNYKGIAYNA